MKREDKIKHIQSIIVALDILLDNRPGYRSDYPNNPFKKHVIYEQAIDKLSDYIEEFEEELYKKEIKKAMNKTT